MTIQREKQALIDLKQFAKDNPEEFQEIIERLNEKRFMIDINITSFNIKTAEYWSMDCSDFIQKRMEDFGYEGLSTLSYTKYYGGSVNEGKYSGSSDYAYVLYDANIWGNDEDESQRKAEEFLDSEFDRWLEKNTN